MDLSDCVKKVLPVVEKTADFIRGQAGKVGEGDVEIKSLNSLVSYVDQQAEKMLVEGLRGISTNAGFITEEETTVQSQSEYTWIIDPLDGTTNFLQNIPFYAVSVALQYQNEIILGVVSDIAHQEVYYAWKGGGAWCNGKAIRVSARTGVQDCVVATGFPYAAKNVVPQLLAVFDYFLKNARGVRRLGSAALDLAYVANGRFDVYYETSLNTWDIAGGIILVREAGGHVTDFAGGRDMLSSGRVIASNRQVHEAVLTQIQNSFDT